MSYFTETYPTSIDVRVTFTHNGETDTFDDAHKGNDIEHALERAQENWPGATIEFLGITQPDEAESDPFGWADAMTEWASEEVSV